MGNSCTASREEVSSEERLALVTQRSETYSFFAAIFNHHPDIQFAENLKRMQSSDLQALFGAVEDDLSLKMDEGLQLLGNFTQSCQDKSPEDIVTELAVDRVCLMRGVKYTYGADPPLESVYIDDKDAHKTLLTVRSSYREAGLDLQKEVKERPDYIGIELDFMGYLAAQEAQALQAGDADAAETFSEKQQVFLTDHLVRWVPKYCQSMFEEAQTDFYRGISCLLSAFVLQESQHI